MISIKTKEHLIKILKSLLTIEDIDIIKYSIESLIDLIEDDKLKEDHTND